MLKIYKDRNKKFEFSMQVEGAENVQNIRMIFEGKNNSYNVLVNGKTENGKICIDIPAFNSFNITEGSAKIEVIADGILLQPWQSDFIVESSVKMNINEKSDIPDKKKIKIKINENNDFEKEKSLYNKVVKSYKLLDENKKIKLKNRYKNINLKNEEIVMLESFNFVKDKNSLISKLFVEQLNKK